MPERVARHPSSYPPILPTLPLSHGDLPPLKIDVLHPQLQALLQPKSRAIQQRRRESGHAVERLQHFSHIWHAQHQRTNRPTYLIEQLRRFTGHAGPSTTTMASSATPKQMPCGLTERIFAAESRAALTTSGGRTRWLGVRPTRSRATQMHETCAGVEDHQRGVGGPHAH